MVKRIITALIGIPFAVFIINYGQWLFALTILILASVAWFEYVRMLKNNTIQVASILGLMGIVLLNVCAWLGNLQEFVFMLFISFLCIAVKSIFGHNTFHLNNAVYTLFGMLYIGVCFAHLILLRFTDASLIKATPLGDISLGAVYLWLAFIGTWASDTFAYFVGCALGRRKLCPLISPAKTVEGFLGGLAGCIICVAAIGYYFGINLWHNIAIGLLVGVAAPCGDLFESLIKRFVHKKDSGNFFPGHGGVLDRFDSIMFAVPVVYYYVNFILLH